MITCPTTKQAISTGVNVDEAMFRNPTIVFQDNTMQCPACGQFHVWSKEDAFLEGEQPPAKPQR
jgi:hypothetical protein